MPIDTAWFQAQLAERKLSQRRLARMMGLDPGAVSLMLHGRRRMSANEVADVSRLLGVPVDEVLRHAGIDARGLAGGSDTSPPAQGAAGVMVPVVGWIDATGVVHQGDVLGPRVVDRPPGFGSAEDVAALRVQSDGLWDGWVLYHQPAKGVSLEAVGQLCVVDVVQGPRMVRVVRRGYERGKYCLTGLDGSRVDGVELETAAPVVWMRQR